jgi:hypothetical protein
MENAQRSQPMPKGRLLLLTGASVVAGTVIVFGAILPAEYNVDVFGLGKMSGLSRLWAPPENEIDTEGAVPLARAYDLPYRSDVIEIPLGGFLEGNEISALEYKVAMAEGATLIYNWEVVGLEDERDFLFDFHGHTVPEPGSAMTVATYEQGRAMEGHGALTAPFDGIQGWLFSNSAEDPVVVRVEVSGFYDLVPAGEEGNLAGIVANVPAAEARTIFPAGPEG